MSDFEKKAELFNNHFASQCSLPNLKYKADERLNYLDANKNEILSIIKTLNACKAHTGIKYLG